MRALIAIVAVILLAALGWSGWWWFGASTKVELIEGWLADRRADGWVAEAEDVSVRGFPGRFDTTVTALDLADPEAGWAWEAPQFQILALAYKPNHVIAVWPGSQTLGSPVETLEVEARVLRGSVLFEPSPRLVLDRTTIEIDEMTIRGESAWRAALGHAVLATRQADPAQGARFAHDVSFVAEGLALPEDWVRTIDRAGVLPEAIEATRLDTTLVFDRPLDRAAVEDENPRLERVLVRDASFVWGRLDLRGRGEMQTDAEGFAEGTLDLRARNWREMLRVATDSGMIDRNVAGAVEAGLGLIARLSADRDSIEVPLVFEDGQARLGPIVIGRAPRLSRGY